jgi:chorismate synthase
VKSEKLKVKNLGKTKEWIFSYLPSLFTFHSSLFTFHFSLNLMPGNTFGTLFRLTTFGESHGPAVGGIVDGCPAGLWVDEDFIQREMDRRRPGQSALVSQRREPDRVRLLSGIMEGRTTGMPIAFVIENEDQRSRDYDHLATVFRPSHADFTWQARYGHRDHRGGGRSSARETAARVAAGALAKLLLRERNIEIKGYVSQVGELRLETPYTELDLGLTESNEVRCPDPAMARAMAALIQSVRKQGDTVGGVVSAVVRGCPAGLGEPVFDKLQADLAKAMLSINAAKGFEYGSGFSGAAMRGSAHNDVFYREEGPEPESQDKEERKEEPGNAGSEFSPVFPAPGIRTRTNFSGGIQGGISNGMDIYFRVAFKPVATLLRDQESVNMAGETVTVQGKGRHDPCVLPRAVPIVEAMAALVLADHSLRSV